MCVFGFCRVLCGAVVTGGEVGDCIVAIIYILLDMGDVGWEFVSRNDSASDVVNLIGAKIELVIFVRFRFWFVMCCVVQLLQSVELVIVLLQSDILLDIGDVR